MLELGDFVDIILDKRKGPPGPCYIYPPILPGYLYPQAYFTQLKKK